jgi:predicted ArsR family transcriptional regulator
MTRLEANERVLALLADDVWLTHKEIAELMRCSIYTAERRIKDLLAQGRVQSRKAYVPAGCPGRPPLEYTAKGGAS